MSMAEETGFRSWVRNVSNAHADEYIGRGSRFGNPFAMREKTPEERRRVIDEFRAWIAHQPEMLRLVRSVLKERTLGCHCAPEPCHGDVLREIASGVWDEAIPAEPVFVFGSNLAGRHGRGAARYAADVRGAQPGVARGPTGSAYALPTKDDALEVRPLEHIEKEIRAFTDHAGHHPEQTFEVTRVGCGLAGYADNVVAPLFSGAPGNVDLPTRWKRIIGWEKPEDPIRVIVAGSRAVKDWKRVREKLDRILEHHPNALIVSGGARGADLLGERYAVQTGRPLRRVPAEWERAGKMAGVARNERMARMATHLVAFWDGASRGTKHMIDAAESGGLTARVVRI